MLTTEADALLDAILDDPEDDTPRLVYADWLEEHGDEADADRAAFIRVQVDLARLGEGDPRRGELLARERDLRQTHEGEWTAPLAGLALACQLRRGFVERVRLDGAALLERGGELFRLAPVRQLELHAEPGQGAELAECPW